MTTLSVKPAPCKSCPYRRDVPSGVWDTTEYAKLPLYDGGTWEQSSRLFLCHQKNGCLCGGWLACHGPRELLALRVHASKIDPSVFDYTTEVAVRMIDRLARGIERTKS